MRALAIPPVVTPRSGSSVESFSTESPHSSTRSASASAAAGKISTTSRSEEHTSELQSLRHLVCRLPRAPPLFPYTTLFRSGHRPLELVCRRHVVARGVNARARHPTRGHPAQRVERGELLDRVAPQLHAQRFRFRRRRKDLHHIEIGRAHV